MNLQFLADLGFTVHLWFEPELFVVTDLRNGKLDIAILIEGFFVDIGQAHLVTCDYALFDMIAEPTIIKYV
jgi:hypothetical protein